MPRTAHGGAFESRGKFYMRVTVAPRERPAKLLPWAVSLEQAQARSVATQALVNRLRDAGQPDFIENLVKSATLADDEKMVGLTKAIDGLLGGVAEPIPAPLPKGAVVTFESFAMRWVRGELAAQYPDYVERKRSAYTDLCYLRKYAFPVIGPKPIVDIELADLERVMGEVAERAKPRKLARGTRRHVAQAVRRVMQLAEYPAKLVARNPIPSNALPRVKSEMALVFVYPEEDALLMRSEADLGLRLLYGFLHRIGWRREEALGGKVDEVDDAVEVDDDALEEVPPLTWRRLDLRRRVILPARNKTNDVELTPLDEDLTRALTAWKAMHPKAGADDPVFVTAAGLPITPDDASEGYRSSLQAALRKADQDRPELWEAGYRRRPLRLHDARASMVTVALRAGKGEDWVRRRTKHKSSALERYRRATSTLAELDLGFWTPLDEVIPEIAAHCCRQNGSGSGSSGGIREGHSGKNPNDSGGVTDGFRTRDNRIHNPSEQVATRSDTQDSREVDGSDETDRDALLPALSLPAAASELDAALARAIDTAAAAGQWDVVAAIVREVAARRDGRNLAKV